MARHNEFVALRLRASLAWGHGCYKASEGPPYHLAGLAGPLTYSHSVLLVYSFRARSVQVSGRCHSSRMLKMGLSRMSPSPLIKVLRDP